MIQQAIAALAAAAVLTSLTAASQPPEVIDLDIPHAGEVRPSATPVSPPSPPFPSRLRSATLALAAGYRGLISVAPEPTRTVTEYIGFGLGASPQALWPWASVTKQVMAILVMQEVAAGRMALDAPVSRYLPAVGRGEEPTIRQLLQHRSGLRDPSATPTDASGMPEFYTSGPTGLAWCAEGRGAAGGKWAYNNCDYIVLGAALEQTSGMKLPQLVTDRIAKPARLSSLRFADGLTAEEMRWTGNGPSTAEIAQLTRFGASGGLVGTPQDMLMLNRALMEGRLLPAEARAQLWQGDPALGYMALGQWSFSAPLKGCAAPVKLIERRGAIGRFQVRNVMAPDLNKSVVMMTADPKFDFGEVWQRSGFTYDVLSAELCA